MLGSKARKVRGSLLALALILPAAALSACASQPKASLLASDCSTLVPAEWRQGVESADLPEGSTAGDWIAFGDRQTGQLDKANGRTRDALTIVEGCEKRDRQTVQRLNKPWWQFWSPGSR